MKPPRQGDKKMKPYMPRVQVHMNTGTRVMKSKKDKQRTRQYLNKMARELSTSGD